MVVSNSTASVITSNNISVVPFNTVMTFKYFKNGKKTYEDNSDEKVKSIFIDQINSLHKLFDRHYNYKDEDGNIITSIKVNNQILFIVNTGNKYRIVIVKINLFILAVLLN